ncbi:hypothetical protein N1F78_07955 [Seonamhaeicola sp. MEBiC1930]|uniref:hypothetical protein n=1 Tax=Seonamhaeicola sp. MEBiC01930 TaxID=2976768 RepID=UPI0032476EE7
MLQKLLLLLFFLISFASLSQSKIQKSEESLKKDSSSSYTTAQSSCSNSDDDESFGRVLFAETIGRVFISIFAHTAYGILVETPFEKNNPSSSAILTKQPYFKSNIGNYNYEWNNSSAVGRTTISSRYVFENSTLNGNHLNADLRFYNKLALELNYLQLWENHPNFGHHTLAIYTALAKYHRVRTKQFDAWWGIGTSYVDGNVDSLGFTIGLGAEIFFGKPISLECNFNHTLLNDNSFNKFNALINYHINQYKLNTGYESLKIGNQKFSTVSLGISLSF